MLRVLCYRIPCLSLVSLPPPPRVAGAFFERGGTNFGTLRALHSGANERRYAVACIIRIYVQDNFPYIYRTLAGWAEVGCKMYLSPHNDMFPNVGSVVYISSGTSHLTCFREMVWWKHVVM